MVIIMKNSKGFTLVELLAVIAILALLILIAVPLVTKYVNNVHNYSNDTILSEAESAAINYGIEHSKILADQPTSTFIQNNCALTYTLNNSNYTNISANCKKTVDIQTLIKDGYFRDDGNKLKRNGQVIIYKYKGDKKTTSECASSNEDYCYNFELKAYADKSLLN